MKSVGISVTCLLISFVALADQPPTGFDYDLVFLTQDVDMMLASLKSVKINKVTIVKNRASVAFALLDTYEFRLIRSGNGWLINEILNISQD